MNCSGLFQVNTRVVPQEVEPQQWQPEHCAPRQQADTGQEAEGSGDRETV
jgi:hypothetical protein